MTLVSRKLYIRLLLEMARIIRKNTTARRESEPSSLPTRDRSGSPLIIHDATHNRSKSRLRKKRDI